jgi:hypothetical protein
MFGAELTLRRQRLGLTPGQLARKCTEFHRFTIDVTAQEVMRCERLPDELYSEDAMGRAILEAVKDAEDNIDNRIAAMKRAIRRETKQRGRPPSSVLLLHCRSQSNLNVLYPGEAHHGLAHHRAFLGMAYAALLPVASESLWVMGMPSHFARWAQRAPMEITSQIVTEWLAVDRDTFLVNPPAVRIGIL